MDLKGAFEAIGEMVKENNPPQEGDYIKDGLLHCGKCHTPKQGVYKFPWGDMKQYCLCQCAVEAEEKEQAERKKAERLQRIEKARDEAFPDAEMKGWTLEKDDHTNERASKIMRRYIEIFDDMKRDGKGLLLYGEVGTGKTFCAASVANALIDREYTCLLTSLTRLINHISGIRDGKQEFIDGLNRYDLLIVDDFATERGTEYADEMVYNIINSRYTAGLPLIVTTNLTAEEIKKPSDIRKERIYSRLWEMCVPVKIEGANRRKEDLKQNFGKYKDLLGI